MCPQPKVPDWELSKQSHVGDLPEPIPTLFQSLVAEPDSSRRWSTKTYPIDFKIVEAKKKDQGKYLIFYLLWEV